MSFSGRVWSASGEVTGPLSESPPATARLVMKPRCTSAAVTVYVPVQVVVSPTARSVVGQVIAPTSGSVTTRLRIAAPPALVTTNW